MNSVKNLTIHLSDDEYVHAKLLADQQDMSLNQLVKEGLKLLEAQARQQQLYNDFSTLGEDLEGADVEYAVYAQNEAVEPN